MSDVLACKLNSDKKIISLSAPVSGLLNRLDLYSDPQLVALSNYHFQAEKVQSKVVAGGLFLSDELLKSWNNSVVFFDASSQFENQFKQHNQLKSISVTTRGKDSYEAYLLSKKLLTPYLVKCEEKLAEIESEVQVLKKQIKAKLKAYTSHLVFIGTCSQTLWPKSLMVQDGVAKLLSNWFGLEQYPSDLSYVSWSEKILNEFLIKKPLILCLSDSNLEQVLVNNNNYLNLYDPQFLLPGINQILALKNLL
jgi:hypothetical protein